VRAALFATLVSWLLWPTPTWADAGASPSTALALDWNAGPGCPDGASAAASIREILGAPIATGASDAVQVDIAPLADGLWEARIVTRGAGGSGERRFVGPTCKLVSDAAVLVVAMTVDPMATAERVTAMRDASQRPAPTAALARPPSSDWPRMLAGLRAAADVGSLPGPSAGLGMALGVQYRRLRVEGEATAWLPRLALARPSRDRGGEIGLYTGALRGCWDGLRSASGELALAGCLEGEAGVTTGQGTTGIARPKETSGLWVAAFAGLTLSQGSAAGLRSWLSLDVGTPIRRPEYVIDEGAAPVAVFQASAVVGRAALGAAWMFP
jgi:hypothetical protein